MALYLIGNGARPGAAAPVAVTTGTVIKTMLQVQPSATKPLRVVEWGISFDGSAAATPVNCELIQCTGAATVTAHVTGGIHRLDGEAILGGMEAGWIYTASDVSGSSVTDITGNGNTITLQGTASTGSTAPSDQTSRFNRSKSVSRPTRAGVTT